MPPLSVWPGLLTSCAPLQLRFVFLVKINVTSLGRDCCPIVDSFGRIIADKDVIVIGLLPWS
jgi:hypothetical protein